MVTSDLHYGATNAGAAERNAANVTVINKLGGTTARGVLVTGDLTDRGSESEWSDFEAHYPLAGGTGATAVHYPVYELAGNHDRASSTGDYDAAMNGVKKRHGDLTYSWDWDGVHFVSLDTYPNYARTTWLENDLASVPTKTPIVIMTHYGFDAKSQSWWGTNGEYWATRSENFKNVIGQHNVVALLHGHGHEPYTYSWEGYDVYEGGTTKTEGFKNNTGLVNISDNTLTYDRYYWTAAGTITWSGSSQKKFTNRYFNGANSTAWNNATTMNWGHSSGYYNSIWIDDSDAIFEGTGAAVDVGTIASVGSMTFNTGYTLNGGSVTMTGAGGNFVTNAGTTTINSSISGSVGLTKQGSGTLTLNGANFYSGITTISGGELLVNGSLSSQSTVCVQNGTLGGSGFIGGAVSVGSLGTLSPGDSIGTLTISNALSLAGNTIMEVNESGTTLTGDRIIDVTTLTYGGMLSVLGSGNDFAIGDAWNLFSANAYEGSFNSYSLPSLPNGLSWNTSQLSYNGTISVVPEPGTLTLLAVGLASLLAYAWPKRK